MTQTSLLCRAQEALQRNRAADTELVNVRAVALRAAEAWHREALRMERRKTNTVPIELGQTNPPELDQHLSENPDRGLAD